MGSLPGHIIPGSFILLMGLAWMFLSLWAYLTKKLKFYHKKPSRYTESDLEGKSYIPIPLCYSVPIEPILKIFLPGIAIIMECFFFVHRDEKGTEHIYVGVWSIYGKDGHLQDQAKLQHLTMHAFFVTSGLVDLLSLYVINFPKHTPKLFLVFAVLVEGFIFHFHTESRTEFNMTVHRLMTYLIFANAFFCILRLYKSANVLVNGGLAFCTSLQGTWLIHVGVALFGKHPLDEENSSTFSSAFMVACFFWHFLLIAVSMLILYTSLSVCLKCITNRRKVVFQPLNTSDDVERGYVLKDLSQV